MNAWEVNFDGLPGLTHHYAGLSFGNEASTKHRYRVSNPQLAAKQGLKKMKALADAGYPQGIIPPQERPNIPLLRQIGFSGSDEQVLEKASRQAPELLSAASSASSMWVANAATVSPSADSLDGRVHLTVANLNDKFHRASEAPTTEALLKAIFPMSSGLPYTARCPRPRCSVMKGRQTITVSAATTAPLACSCLFTVVSRVGKRARSATRRGRRWRPARPLPASTWSTPGK